jgi:hypothetical protein
LAIGYWDPQAPDRAWHANQQRQFVQMANPYLQQDFQLGRGQLANWGDMVWGDMVTGCSMGGLVGYAMGGAEPRNCGLTDVEWVLSPEDGVFTGKYKCKETGEEFALCAAEKPAVERGLSHFAHRWQNSIHHLKAAGLQADELLVPLRMLKPRLVKESERERDLEIGVRQSEKKARELLLMCLTPEQKAEFAQHHYFTVNVDHRLRKWPKGEFRIRKASAYNVEHVRSDAKFCIVAAEKVPIYDQLLTQKLLLEQEPLRFFETANHHGRWKHNYEDEPPSDVIGEALHDFMQRFGR